MDLLKVDDQMAITYGRNFRKMEVNLSNSGRYMFELSERMKEFLSMMRRRFAAPRKSCLSADISARVLSFLAQVLNHSIYSLSVSL